MEGRARFYRGEGSYACPLGARFEGLMAGRVLLWGLYRSDKPDGGAIDDKTNSGW